MRESVPALDPPREALVQRILDVRWRTPSPMILMQLGGRVRLREALEQVRDQLLELRGFRGRSAAARQVVAAKLTRAAERLDSGTNIAVLHRDAVTALEATRQLLDTTTTTRAA